MAHVGAATAGELEVCGARYAANCVDVRVDSQDVDCRLADDGAGEDGLDFGQCSGEQLLVHRA